MEVEKKRYLFVTYRMSDGGAERVISRLSDELIRRGCDVGIYIYLRTENEYYINPQITLFSINRNKNLSRCKMIRGLKRLILIWKAAREFQPDYIIPLLSDIVIESFFAAKSLRIPFIATMRNIPQDLGVIKNVLLWYAFKNSDAIWLQTESQRKYLSKGDNRKAFVCPNPVSHNVIEQGKKHTYQNRITNFVTLGRLAGQKNQKMLIRAMIKAHRVDSELTLKIYGVGPEAAALRTLIVDNHAEDYIFLMGRTENAIQVLDEADCFVLSSDFEGMPNALMEAMGVGLPCISTDCPTGSRELLNPSKENKCGVLVPINNYEKMCEAILLYVNNPKQAIEYGKKARDFICNSFDVKIITDIFISECEKLR